MVIKTLTSIKKLNASTLLEVVTAMVIIIVIFGISMMIYTNVTQSSKSEQKVRADEILNDYMLGGDLNSNNFTNTFTIGDFRIEKEINSYKTSGLLLQVNLTAYDVNNFKVAELSEIILKKK